MADEPIKRGFAAMTPERAREVRSMGGKAVPAEKRGFSADPQLAKRAGSKGGSSVRMRKRSFPNAIENARKGGVARKAKFSPPAEPGEGDPT